MKKLSSLVLSVLALVVVGLSLAACSRPEPPRITPKEVKLVSISNQGIEIVVTLAAENPNGIDLDASSVEATLTFDGGMEIGKTSATKAVHLPAHRTVDLSVPVALKWKNVSALAPYALRDKVPYTVKGQVKMGGALEIGVPFTIEGALTRADLMKLALSVLPGIPGLQ